MELELKVEGMVCDGCSSRVAEALKVLIIIRECESQLIEAKQYCCFLCG